MDDTETRTTQNMAVVAFKMEQRIFAMPLDVIVQILPMMEVTPIPHISNIVKGTINIRGEDALVISLRNHFDMEDAEPQLYTPLLLIKLNGRNLALIVDAVMDVLNLPVENVTNLSKILPEGIENIPMLKGIAHYKDDTVLVLDPNQLFYNDKGIAFHHFDARPSADFDTPVEHNTPVKSALVSSVQEAQTPENG